MPKRMRSRSITSVLLAGPTVQTILALRRLGALICMDCGSNWFIYMRVKRRPDNQLVYRVWGSLGWMRIGSLWARRMPPTVAFSAFSDTEVFLRRRRYTPWASHGVVLRAEKNNDRDYVQPDKQRDARAERA